MKKLEGFVEVKLDPNVKAAKVKTTNYFVIKPSEYILFSEIQNPNSFSPKDFRTKEENK